MSRRGQLVLLAAALAAVALVPVAAAYFQLGAHPDVTARTDPGVESDRVLRGLDRAVTNASIGVSGSYAWSDREAAATRIERAMTADAAAIARAAANRSTVVTVGFNATAAASVDRCPDGPNRAFGDCTGRDGLVLQERAGETHLVAVALDVRVIDPRGATRLTVVLTVV